MAQERYRTAEFHKLWMVDLVELTDEGYAKVPPCDVIPEEYSDFTMSGMVPLWYKRTAACHFYLDDYRFERVWNQPAKYLEVLRDYKCVVQPDFSLYLDMPKPVQRWNKYRSNLLAAYWAGCGIPVLPNLVWSDVESFGWCFEGIPKGSVVSTTALGTVRDRDARYRWELGMAAALEATEPTTVLVYGQMPPDFDWGGAKAIQYKNRRLQRVRDLKKGA